MASPRVALFRHGAAGSNAHLFPPLDSGSRLVVNRRPDEKNMTIRSKHVEYSPADYFDSWHRSTSELSDRITISPTFSNLASRYHYNLVETKIMEFFGTREEFVRDDAPPRRLLDIGSGAGHWIDFFGELFELETAIGIEISTVCAEKLRAKYASRGADLARVEIRSADVSSPDFDLGGDAHIISAIGVMFHIVNDDKWRQALANLARCMTDDGVLVVGGEFGERTEDIQFHKIDRFSSWQERTDAWEAFGDTESEEVFVNKRVRSRALWEEAARAEGLAVVALGETKPDPRIRTPQNNVLFLRKAAGREPAG